MVMQIQNNRHIIERIHSEENLMTTILIIDDDPMLLSNLATILEFEGFSAIVSLNGPEAIESLSERPVDLILCDMLMEPMNGFEILKSVRNNPNTVGTPFVFVTAVSWDGVEIDGATGYLMKPFTNDRLLEIVREQLGM